MNKELSNNQEDNYLSTTPVEIIDKEAYNTSIILEKLYVLNEGRIFETSDDNIVIDLGATYEYISNRIRGLPEEEQLLIKAKARIVNIHRSKIGTYRSKAYALRLGSKSPDESILSPRKLELIEMFGRYFTAKDVHEYVNNELNIYVSLKTVEKFRIKYIKEIKEKREEHQNSFNEMRLAHKKSRLEEYSWLYEMSKRKSETNDAIKERDFLRLLLADIRKECEGDVITVNGNIQMTIEATLNIHIQQELLKKLTLSEIILSRIAVKHGLNPLILLSKLQTSYYSKFSGYNISQDFDISNQEPIYPSAHVYDLDKLQRLNIDRDSKEKIHEGVIVDEYEETLKIKSSNKLKDILAQRIKSKNSQLNDSIDNISKMDG